MADALINLLQSRTVLIRAANAVGTGTLIAPGVVLTCAHVVRNAENQPETITVSLPDLKEPGKSLWTEIPTKVYLSNKYVEPYETPAKTDAVSLEWYKKEYPDVAVLKIDQENHDIIKFSRYNDRSFDLKNKQFLAFGFQNADKDLKRNSPEAVSLIYSGEQVDGIIRKLIFVQGQIRPGMSGAGLIERESGELIGIVHKTKSPNDDLGAYVIPSETIWRVIQNWHNDNLNELFIHLRSKELEANVKKQYLRDYPQFTMLRKHWPKLLLILILIFFSLFWALFHKGLTTGSGITSIIFVSIGLFSAFLGGWLGKKVNEETGKFRDNIGKILLGKFGSFLLFLWLVALIYFWTFRSSVWIHGYSESDKIDVLVKHGKDLNDVDTLTLNPSGKATVSLASVPFGEAVTIASKGRKDTAMILKSFNRIDLFFPRNFPLEPVAIFRIDPAYPLMNQMVNYRLEVQIERKVDNKWAEAYNFSIEPGKDTGCFVLGRYIDTKERETDWEDVLRNDIKTDVSLLDRSLKIWKDFEYIPNIDLNNEDRITIQVFGKRKNAEQLKDSVYNKKIFFIGGNRLDKLVEIRTK